MDGIANVAKQQQSQMKSAQTEQTHLQQTQVQQPKQVDLVKEMQKENSPKIDSKEQVQDLVNQLNNALAPMNTNIKFGVDQQDIFYVSVVESETSKMIRRFPAEQAAEFLPKMQEVTGILFDSKG
jgi:flagellar protein FlaG